MGVFTQVARFFQRIESPTVTRQFQLVVQDYGKDKNLEAAIRKAMAEAATHPGVEARDVMIAGLKAFAVTDRSSGNPTTLVTVIVLPSRLVLAQGANVDRDAALKLLVLRGLPPGRGGEVTPAPVVRSAGRAARTGRAWSSSTGSSRASRSCTPPNDRRRPRGSAR